MCFFGAFSIKVTPVFARKAIVSRVNFSECVWIGVKVHFLVSKSALFALLVNLWLRRPGLVTARIGRVRRNSKESQRKLAFLGSSLILT